MPSKTERSSPAAPEETDLVLAFVNTHAGGRGELLGTGASLREWLDAVGYPDPDATDADAAAAREFRDALQTLLLAHGDTSGPRTEASSRAEAHLARVAAQTPLQAIVTTEGMRLRPTVTGVRGAFGAVFASIAELDRADVWRRVKACSNEICHEGFFDRSRNVSAVYHSSTCATAVAMRAYRRRAKAAGSDAQT